MYYYATSVCVVRFYPPNPIQGGGGKGPCFYLLCWAVYTGHLLQASDATHQSHASPFSLSSWCISLRTAFSLSLSPFKKNMTQSFKLPMRQRVRARFPAADENSPVHKAAWVRRVRAVGKARRDLIGTALRRGYVKPVVLCRILCITMLNVVHNPASYPKLDQDCVKHRILYQNCT